MSNVKYLLPPVKQQFKANLHTHSRLSDGSLTPAEVKELFHNAGFSIVAMTDHNIVADHSELSDEDFLFLTGGEFNMTPPEYTQSKGKKGKNYHFCFIAKQPDNLWQPFPMKRIREFTVPYVAKSQPEDMPHAYDLEQVNAIIARANEKGFLVTYNHPVWSMQDYTDWSGLKGLWAMEVCNAGCIALGLNEHNENVYHTMLRLGMRIVPVCASDMHDPQSKSGYVYYDKAWCMVCAEKLDYESVIRALEQGDMYASLGPEIHELTMESGVVNIRCSPAVTIQLETHARTQQLAIPKDGAQTIDGAQFDLNGWIQEEKDTPGAFFRITVNGPDGCYAVTRAYWMEDILK